MIQKLLLIAALCLTTNLRADPLPTFEDFRRVDRARRQSGQLQTAESLVVTRVDPALLRATAEKNPADWQMQWGAAELITDWTTRRALYESALAGSGTNIAVVTRYALFAARQGDREVAGHWLRHIQQAEPDNLVPWLAAHWLQATGVIHAAVNPPKLTVTATHFRDYAPSSARARIRLLEAAGYSPFSARRLGFMPDTPGPQMARELVNAVRADPTLASGLLRLAQALQEAPPFLLHEFIGQSIEHAIITAGFDTAFNTAKRDRTAAIQERRQELKTLLAEVEHGAAELATEQEMTKYFDDVLAFGEETALDWLRTAPTQSDDAPASAKP